MAQTSLLLIYTVRFYLCVAFASAIDYHRRPMILPLHLSSPKANRHHRRAFDGRRLQRSEPNAHMRLYDDLLANWYYSTRVWIGTPPQKFALIVDTGSSVTYVPCSDCQRCERCGSHQVRIRFSHKDLRFQPNSSSTYQLVKCNANCNCDEEGSKCTCKRQYAEGSSSIGVLGEDTSFLLAMKLNLCKGMLFLVVKMLKPVIFTASVPRVLLVIHSHYAGGMGVGGMKSPHDMFGFCNCPYYNIELKGIYVAAYPLKLNPKVFDGGYGTVLDSGTFPRMLFLRLRILL